MSSKELKKSQSCFLKAKTARALLSRRAHAELSGKAASDDIMS